MFLLLEKHNGSRRLWQPFRMVCVCVRVRVLFAFKRNAQATSREIITFPRSNVLCSVYRVRGHQLRRLIYVFNSWLVYRFPYGLTYSPKALLTALPLKLLLCVCVCVCVHVDFLPGIIPLIASLCSTAKVIIAADEKGNASLYAMPSPCINAYIPFYTDNMLYGA